MVTRAAPGGRRTRRRRSQEERREATRGAVLDATVECLAERGYAGTTTTRIARRARVSRGALLHYYASKIELLTSAIEHILRRREQEFRAAFVALPADADRRAAAIDILWGWSRARPSTPGSSSWSPRAAIASSCARCPG